MRMKVFSPTSRSGRACRGRMESRHLGGALGHVNGHIVRCYGTTTTLKNLYAPLFSSGTSAHGPSSLSTPFSTACISGARPAVHLRLPLHLRLAIHKFNGHNAEAIGGEHRIETPRPSKRIKELKNRMRSLRSLFGEPLDRTNRLPVVAVAAARAVVARNEEEVPRAIVVARARNGRPVVAERTGIVERSPVAVAGAGEEDTG